MITFKQARLPRCRGGAKAGHCTRGWSSRSQRRDAPSLIPFMNGMGPCRVSGVERTRTHPTAKGAIPLPITHNTPLPLARPSHSALGQVVGPGRARPATIGLRCARTRMRRVRIRANRRPAGRVAAWRGHIFGGVRPADARPTPRWGETVRLHDTFWASIAPVICKSAFVCPLFLSPPSSALEDGLVAFYDHHWRQNL